MKEGEKGKILRKRIAADIVRYISLLPDNGFSVGAKYLLHIQS